MPRALRRFNQHRMRTKEAGVFRKQKEVCCDRQVVWGQGTMGRRGMKKLVSCIRSVEILDSGVE